MHACEEMSQTIIDKTIYFIQLQYCIPHAVAMTTAAGFPSWSNIAPSLLKGLIQEAKESTMTAD
jgi:hypothetical protein